MKKTFLKSGKALYCLYVLIYMVITWMMNHYVLTRELYQSSWSEQMDSSRIEQILSQQYSIAWVAYLFIPILIYLQILFPTICIYLYMQFREQKIRWSAIFRIALDAEIVLLIPMALKMLWFLLIPAESLTQVSAFSPWSLSIFLSDDAPAFLTYIFQSINIFELVYIIALISGIRNLLHNTIRQSTKIIGTSYGFGLLAWMSIVSFIFIQLQ